MIKSLRYLPILFVFFGLVMCPAQAELDLVKTDHPRDTMRTFMLAMQDYKVGVETGDREKKKRIAQAIRTLNLSSVPYVLREEKGKEAAIFLKEVIDRVLVIDYEKIPTTSGNLKKPLLRWRLKNTEISIAKQTEGERAGEYLFTQDTVHRAREFYEMVRDTSYVEGSGGGAVYRTPWLEKILPSWIQGKALNLYHWQWIGLLVAIFIGLLLKRVVECVVELLKRLGKVVRGEWYDRAIVAVERPIGLVAATTFWFFCLHLLQLEGLYLNVLSVLVQVIFSYALIWLAYRLCDVLSDYFVKLAGRTETELDDQLAPLFGRALRIFVIVLGTLIAIQNLGINVMSVLAGLGLGGLAFALAAKDTAANLFGSIMILTDKPFRVGDWIVAAGQEGTVEEVGFRSTRIRTFYDSQVVIPNSTLANANIDNMGRRVYRRQRATLGVTYDTPPEKLEAFLEGIKNVIQANPHTRKDYFHVVFSGYGPSSLDIMLYFFLKVPNWSEELVERQNVYLEILRLAKSLGVDFAYPTQSLHVESFPEKKGLREPHTVDIPELKRAALTFGPKGEHAQPGGGGIYTPPFRE